MRARKGISSFSVVLLMAVAAVVGAACFSMLKVQYTPSGQSRSITVRYSYPEASARTVEAEVTSKIEGLLSTIRECRSVSSLSSNGGGRVTITIGRNDDIEAVRFEVASKIRNIYPSLPDGCSYPSISLSAMGERSRTAISWNIKSSLPPQQIARWVEEYAMYPLSTVEGVNSVSFSGDTRYELVVTFDAEKAESAGITAARISSAISEHYASAMIGMARSGGNIFSVQLRNRSSDDPAEIPVAKTGDRIVRLGDIAEMRYQEALPDSYYRINGLNTLTLRAEVSPDANLLEAVEGLKERMAQLETIMPEEFSLSVGYDYSEYISSELDKIYFRTLLCLAILLAFVFAVGRSWRYMLVIALTLTVNLLISVALYFFIGLHIHIYTLAGITVSLGIIIDNSIMMIDHYSRYGDRSVFPSLVSAVATTVVALLAIFLLPETERTNLADFAIVISVNLAVSLLVSWLFVPALLHYLPIRYDSESARHSRHLRRTVRWNRFYCRYIAWATRHRWVLVLAFVAAFGIPVFLLKPDEVRRPGEERKESVLTRAREEISSWKWLGSSFGLFHEALSRSDFYREPARPSLTINAGMPEGCSVQQLNEVIKSMENYLARFDEIELFETRISSYSNGTIEVLFKPEYEGTAVPMQIKSDIIYMANNFGGANWRVYGLDQNSFNNNVVSSYRMYGISLTGYNYDELLDYGAGLAERIAGNRRVQGVEIWGSEYGDRPATEFNLRYDREALTAFGVNPYSYYGVLSSPLFNSRIGSIPYGGGTVPLRLKSSAGDEFDLWHVNNFSMEVGGGKMKLSEVGGVTKELTGIPIRKEDQSYLITVRFDYIGMSEPARRFVEQEVDRMNSQVLPIGYLAKDIGRGWFYDNEDSYAGLILLIIAGIFVLIAVHFNSLRHPLAIIFLIPVSFIGLFLTFGLTGFVFDQGGFAAFVMLSGITVNAGIYLVAAWIKSSRRLDIRSYAKAFNRKIWPISLTVLSTILGLVPFLFDGPDEVFWFCFAVGTISGLIFSIIALVFYLPAFACRKPGKNLKFASADIERTTTNQ